MDNSSNNTLTITIAILQNPSNLLKNSRYKNKGMYQYNLRSKVSIAIYSHLIAQYMSNVTVTVNYIYRADGKKETIDLLIREKNKAT